MDHLTELPVEEVVVDQVPELLLVEMGVVVMERRLVKVLMEVQTLVVEVEVEMVVLR
jgi:hypothetical protein